MFITLRIQFKGLFNIEFMVKYCLRQINKHFNLIHLKNIIENNVYLNVYELLQVIYSLCITTFN